MKKPFEILARLHSLIILTLLCSTQAQGQVILEGYVFEDGNRGWLNEVRIDIHDEPSDTLIMTTYSMMDGKFLADLQIGRDYRLYANKDLFQQEVISISADSTAMTNSKIFTKVKLKRKPGYLFEITLADKKSGPFEVVDAIRGARIEVYNNTTRTEQLLIESHTNPDFQVNLANGNHYTMMVRKEGYLAKRMEAYVDVEGCILCLEGFGSVEPGVADNLTEGNDMGTLLANIEMEKAEKDKKIELKNIYFATAKWDITERAAIELDKAITFLTDNPGLVLELGAHTDSRGSTESNQILSQKRAKSSAEYLIENGNIDPSRLSYKGYGESQLVNECADGIRCEKWQHAKNRRTELKITGEIAKPEIISLKRMKEEEHKEELLKEIMNQEEVRIPESGDLPEVIRKQIQQDSTKINL